MPLAKVCIVLGGALSFLMACFHTRFHRMFHWDKDFEKMSLLNRKILFSIHIALLLLFFLFSFLSFAYLDELADPKGLAFGITITYSAFWLWRLIWQITYFKPKKAKPGNKRPLLHYILLFVFALLFIDYLVPPLLTLLQT